MIICIAGCRHFNDGRMVVHAIKRSSFNIKTIVSGMARGIDWQAAIYAKIHNIPLIPCKPDYERLNKYLAPKVRNRHMADISDGLIAIWDGYSTGTKHMIECMDSLGKPVELHIYRNINVHNTSVL